MAIAAAIAILATQDALAADQCAFEVASGLREAPPMSLDPERPDALLIEGELVPISLAIGASAVAPRTIHAVGDATIEAETVCDGPLVGTAGAISQDEPRHPSAPPIALEACLGREEAVANVAQPRSIVFRPPAQAPLRGVVRTIDRPPRA